MKLTRICAATLLVGAMVLPASAAFGADGDPSATSWAFDTPRVIGDQPVMPADESTTATGDWNFETGEVAQSRSYCVRSDFPTSTGTPPAAPTTGVFPSSFTGFNAATQSILYSVPPGPGEVYSFSILDFPCASAWGLTGDVYVAGASTTTGVLDRDGLPQYETLGGARYMSASPDGTIAIWDFGVPTEGYFSSGNNIVSLFAKTTAGTQIQLIVYWQFAGLGAIGAGDLDYEVAVGESVFIPETDLQNASSWMGSTNMLTPKIAVEDTAALTPGNGPDGAAGFFYSGVSEGVRDIAYEMSVRTVDNYTSDMGRISVTTTAGAFLEPPTAVLSPPLTPPTVTPPAPGFSVNAGVDELANIKSTSSRPTEPEPVIPTPLLAVVFVTIASAALILIPRRVRRELA